LRSRFGMRQPATTEPLPNRDRKGVGALPLFFLALVQLLRKIIL
jgi:hypothetical protein